MGTTYAAAAVDRPTVVSEPSSVLVRLLDALAASHWLGTAARRLTADGERLALPEVVGPEAGALIALALRPTDPALLHRPHGSFYLARAIQAGRAEAVLDVARAMLGGAEEPLSGGRQLSVGHPDLGMLPPQALPGGHLARALGIAWTLGRQGRAGRPGRLGSAARVPLRWPDDAIVLATMPAAAINHTLAAGVLNAASWTVHQGIALPLLLVIEDPGVGVTVRSPHGWVRTLFEGRAGVQYLRDDDAADLASRLALATEAASIVRQRRVPVVLHLSAERSETAAAGGRLPLGAALLSDGPSLVAESPPSAPAGVAPDAEGAAPDSAGTGPDSAGTEPESDGEPPSAGTDPEITGLLLTTAKAIVEQGLMSIDEVTGRIDLARQSVESAVAASRGGRQLASTLELMQPLIPSGGEAIAERVGRSASEADRAAVFDQQLPEAAGPLTVGEIVQATLIDCAAAEPRVIVLEATGQARGLQQALGSARVVPVAADGPTTLGLALGASVAGLVPIAQLTGLGMLGEATSVLRDQAAPLRFHTAGALANPMLLRVPWGEGPGGVPEGGVQLLRDLPGVLIACLAHPADAAAMLRTCLASAVADGQVCVVFEPTALVGERDAVAPGDAAWQAEYAAPNEWSTAAVHVPVGRAAVWGGGEDLTLAAFGRGVRQSMRVAARLASEGVTCRVVDLRWLSPLPVGDVLREAQATGRLLVVDETRRTGGISEALVTGVLEGGFAGQLARVCAPDTFPPPGEAAELAMLRETEIEEAARLLLTA